MTSLKEMAGHRGPKFGTCIMEFESPGIGHIYKAAGAEFVFVDCEHSGIGIEGLKRILRYLEAAEMPHFVRPPGKTYPHVANALDAGAEGLLLPMVGSADEIREILGYMKYHPDGSRGVALTVAHDRYSLGPTAEKLAAANARTVCIPLIETRDGLENIDAIAREPGVDMLWIGHFDLSCSLGIPGAFDHPDFIAAHARIAKAARDAGKSLGRLVGTPEEGRHLVGTGDVDFICYGTDVGLLLNAAKSGLDAMRDAQS